MATEIIDSSLRQQYKVCVCVCVYVLRKLHKNWFHVLISLLKTLMLSQKVKQVQSFLHNSNLQLKRPFNVL